MQNFKFLIVDVTAVPLPNISAFLSNANLSDAYQTTGMTAFS
jgi:hypothetical protein